MKKRSSFRFRILAILLIFFAASFLLLASRDGNPKQYLMAAAVPGMIFILMVLPVRVFSLDRPSLSIVLTLCGFSLLATAPGNSDETLSQGFRCFAALFFLAAGVILIRTFRPSVPVAVLLALCGLGMLSFSKWFPDLPFSLAGGGIPLLLFAVVAFLALRLRFPALAASLGGMLLLLLQHDYGNAAAWGLSCVMIFWASSGSALWSGILLGCTGGLFGILLRFPQPAVEDAVPSLLSRIAAMPLILPETLPEIAMESTPDSLFFLLGEQYGLVFPLCAVVLVILFLIRSASLAQNARKSFHASLALGIILLTGLRLLLFLSAAADLVHLSPGSFPFMTSSLPDLFACFFLFGLLSGISARNEADLDEDTRLAMLAR